MEALDAAAKAAASGKSLKRRNITWLVATGIVDVVVLPYTIALPLVNG